MVLSLCTLSILSLCSVGTGKTYSLFALQSLYKEVCNIHIHNISISDFLGSGADETGFLALSQLDKCFGSVVNVTGENTRRTKSKTSQATVSTVTSPVSGIATPNPKPNNTYTYNPNRSGSITTTPTTTPAVTPATSSHRTHFSFATPSPGRSPNLANLSSAKSTTTTNNNADTNTNDGTPIKHRYVHQSPSTTTPDSKAGQKNRNADLMLKQLPDVHIFLIDEVCRIAA